MPGPAVVTATRFTSSPVGPYLRLAVAEPARVGGRAGWCLTTVVVDQPQARLGERLNWGMPAALGSLRWLQHDDVRSLEWEGREVVVRARPRGPRFPLVVPVRSLQLRGDGPVVVPGRMAGRARMAKVEVEVGEADELAWLGGPHRGLAVSGMQQVVREARHPVGLTATLLAPARSPEPGLCEVAARYGAHSRPGAYSSVG